MRADQIPITDTYEDVRRLIYKLVRRVHQRYGGDVDEMLSVANVGFMRAYAKFDPKRAQFNTILGLAVYRHLVNFYRSERRHYLPSLNRVKGRDDNDEGIQWIDLIPDTRPERFDLPGFAGDLSHDAQLVLGLVLTTPQEIVQYMTDSFGNVAVLRAGIKKYLRHAGWSRERIKGCFAEIKGAL